MCQMNLNSWSFDFEMLNLNDVPYWIGYSGYRTLLES